MQKINSPMGYRTACSSESISVYQLYSSSFQVVIRWRRVEGMLLPPYDCSGS